MYLRISSSRPKFTAITDFAGGANPHTMLSSMQTTLLNMFDTKSVQPLRSVCKDFKRAIENHPWSTPSLINKDLIKWRSSFPNALSVNLSPLYNTLNDSYMVHLQGVRTIDLSYCRHITGYSFHYLYAARTLNISGCIQITNSSLQDLVYIEDLDITCCRQLDLSSMKNLWALKHVKFCWCNADKILSIPEIRTVQKLTIVNCQTIFALA